MTTRPPSDARAREVDLIVADIVDDMASGRWVSGKSHREIAAREGVSIERVKDWATEAGRTLRILAMVDREELRARNAATLENIAARALEAKAYVVTRDGGEYVDEPDFRAAVAAVAEQARILGLIEQRTKLDVNVSVEAFAKLPPPEMLTKVREQIAALQELERDLARTVDMPALPAHEQENDDE